jgi:hypothetical protein
MSQQEKYEEWACTLPANDDSQFSSGEDDKSVLEEENEDEDEWDKDNKVDLMPRDGQLQQYNASTPQTRGARRRKIRDEEEQIACQKHVQTTQYLEGNTAAAKRSPYYRGFPESLQCNIHPTNNDSHAYAGLINSDVICYSNSILQVIESCIHLTEFFLSPPSNEHQHFRFYYKFANVIHSMVTGGPDVVNPYKFVDIFLSYPKKIVANECTYMHVVLLYIVLLLYCDIVILSYWSVVLCCHIVVLLYCDIVVLSYCSVLLYCHIVVLLYYDIVMLSYCSVVLMMFLLLFVMLLSANDSVHFVKHQRTGIST